MHWKNQRSLAGIWSLPFHTWTPHSGRSAARSRESPQEGPPPRLAPTLARTHPLPPLALHSFYFSSRWCGAHLRTALSRKGNDTAEQERSQWRECSDILTGFQGCGGELARSEQVLLVVTGTIPGGKNPFLAGVWMSHTARVSFANKLG